MAEGAKVRLVRCPKCENVLPELPNMSVYQCGGCGAVLQAKNQKTISGDGLVLKLDEEKGSGSSEKAGSLNEKGEVGTSVSGGSEVSDTDRNGADKLVRRERRAGSSSSSTTRNENKVVRDDLEISDRDKDGINNLARRERRAGSGSSTSSRNENKIVSEDIEGFGFGGRSVEQEIRNGGEMEPSVGIAKRSRQFPYRRPEERDGSTAYRRTPRAVSEGVRFNSSYPDEGPSDYGAGSLAGERLRKDNNSGGADRVEHLEQNRAELLRKLEELQDQLTRSCEVSDKAKEMAPLDGRNVPFNSYGSHDTRFSEGPLRPHGPSVPADRDAQRPLYSNQGIQPIPLRTRHAMDMQNFYPPPHATNEFPGYGDPFVPRVSNRQPPHQYPQPSHDYFPEQYMDIERDHIASYPQGTFFHQPACSCLRCYHNHLQVSAHVPPVVFNNRRFLDAPTNPIYHLENHGPYGQRGYNPKDANYPPAHSHEPPPLIRRQRDLDTEIGAFVQNLQRRIPLGKRSARHSLPIAGGAPFITCHNCFEVLPLRRKHLVKEKDQRKLRCGACSTVISFLVEGNRIITTIPAQNKEISSAGQDDSAVVVAEETLHYNGHSRGATLSDEYDHSGYNFQSVDTEPVLSLTEQRKNSSDSEKRRGLVSSHSTSSEDEESPDSVIVRTSNSAEKPLGASATPPLPGSPLHKRFENSSSDQVVSKSGKGNRSMRRSQEEVLTKITSRQNSVKDASGATEMEVSYNEYSNADMSQDSGEVSREEERPRKGFVGFIKKGLRDFSRSSHMGENEKSNVSINGHPIPEKLIKKAEKQAGPIHPGNYWYDSQAGFWGVMGYPCLGIIPPSIEEFNYPMPKDCAGGNTGIFVNGRELHQKDLDLLAKRGLPTTLDKSYSIEISGKVVDEYTGEELESLGKLAPTIEKVKHGFGMRGPKVTV